MENRNHDTPVAEFEFPFKVQVYRPRFTPLEVVHYLAADEIALEDNVDIEIGTFRVVHTEAMVVARVRKGVVEGIHVSPGVGGTIKDRHTEPQLDKLFQKAQQNIPSVADAESYPKKLSAFFRNIVVGPVDIDIEGQCLVICHRGWCCYFCNDSELIICFGPPVFN